MTRIDFRVRPATSETRKYRNYRVLLDGVDVTSYCFLADDETGEVGHYVLHDDGKLYRDTPDGPARAFRTGKVELAPPETPSK